MSSCADVPVADVAGVSRTFYSSGFSVSNGIRKGLNELSKKVNVVQTVRRTAVEYIEVVGMLTAMCVINHKTI